MGGHSGGRKRIPAELKRIKGTLRKDQEVEGAIQVNPIGELPKPPVWLSVIGKKYYFSIGKTLYFLGLLNGINIESFVSLCHWLSVFRMAEKEIRKEGRVLHGTTKDGSKTSIVNPNHKISIDAFQMAKGLMGEFGMTPATQSKIISQLTAKPKRNDIEDIIGEEV
jgi:P27 family predicted phage terminase small subunit